MGKVRGFSLLEMIAVMIILGIIMAAGATILNAGFTSYFTGVKLTALTSQANIAMTRMKKELELANQITAISQTPSPSVTFTIPTSSGPTTITYSLSGQTLQRTVSGFSAQTLSDQVTNFSLNFYLQNLSAWSSDPSLADAVTISLTLSNSNERVPLINTIYFYNIT